MYYEPMVESHKRIPLPALVTFDAVARHLNFGRAAVELNVTATAVSKTIKQLEAQLGVRLFNRTTRSVSLSEPGAKLSVTLSPALEQIRQAMELMGAAFGRPYGTLRINSSYVAHACLIADHLPTFQKRFPEVELEISVDNTLTDIVAAGFDAGIRLGHAVHRDMVAVPLGPLQRRVVMASPKYLAGRTAPKKPEDLMEHDCIRQRFSGRARFYEWAFRMRGRRVVIDVDGSFVFDEMRSVLEAARNGCGLGYVFEQFAMHELKSGALIPLLEKYSPPSEAFHLYYPARVMMPGKLRAFLDFIRDVNRAR